MKPMIKVESPLTPASAGRVGDCAHLKQGSECLYCGKQNLHWSTRCAGCGAVLPTESEGSHLPKEDASDPPGRGTAERKMVSGALWCIGGIALTLFSYLAAASSPS